MNILARLRPLCLLLLAPLLLTACVDSDELPDDARGNFEALWRIIDEHYWTGTRSISATRAR